LGLPEVGFFVRQVPCDKHSLCSTRCALHNPVSHSI
jgi:hypothetical protein